MKKEVVVNAKTIEEAVELGAVELGMDKDDVTYEVIELPKKGFLGLGSTDAKVKVFGSSSPSDTAVEFLEKIIGHMKLNAMPKIISETESEIKIDIVGSELGTLIGYHGEILDAMQYLTYLAVNKGDEAQMQTETSPTDKYGSGGIKITLDVENYRSKREETLRQLAKKMADMVIKFGRPVTLEPMNAYERRIIHAAVQDIEGVGTHSVGQENERRIVMTKANANGVNAKGFTTQQRRPSGSGSGTYGGQNRGKDRDKRQK